MSAAPLSEPSGLIPMFQPRRAAFWVFWLIVAAGIHSAVTNLSFGWRVMPVSFAAGLIAWTLYTLPVLWLFRRLGLFRGQSASPFVMAFLWGGLAATYLAVAGNAAVFGILSKLVEPGFVWGAAIAGPSNEEPLKLIGVILLVLIAPARFRSIAVVMALGAMVGLGFQVVEDFYYTVNGALNHPNADQFEPVVQKLIMRGLFSGLWSHAAYTTVASFGVGYFVARRGVPLAQRVLVAAAALFAAWALHAFWNSPLLISLLEDAGALGMAAFFLLKGMPVLIAVVLLWRVARREGVRGS
jgi:RsiW-degrading membrane proteinase PrsW (M82 family)